MGSLHADLGSLPKSRVILDMDPGIDDALALMLALRSGLEVVGVTTVAGNVEIEKTTRNACRILKFMGREDVPVGRGLRKPLLRGLKTCPEVHGEDGLGECGLPDSSLRTGFFLDLWRELPAGTVAVCTGPLSNVAVVLLALSMPPVERLVVMGGALGLKEWGKGNVNGAEFNFHTDPEAVSVVFQSGIPITLVPLDVTMDPSIKVDRNFLSKLHPLSREAELAVRLLNFQVDRLGETYLHDVVALSYLLDPSIFSTRHLSLSIDLEGGRLRIDPGGTHIETCVGIDGARFLELFKRGLFS